MRCAIIGLGRIGSALYKDLWPRLPYLTGLDIDPRRVQFMRDQGYNATMDYALLSDIDTWIICSASGSNMENIFSIIDHIDPKPGCLISIESTLRVGTMAQVASRFQSRGYEVGRDVFLIHVPHRVMFGVDTSTISMPRVIGGVTKACLGKGRQFYGGFIEDLFSVGDVRLAELAKVVENSQRHVDIAYAEAVAMYCRSIGLDFGTLRDAVNTKANVSMANVDYGIGGECLPKDIAFLNEACPSPVFSGAMETDRLYRKSLVNTARAAGSRVLVRGIGYKPGMADTYKSCGVEMAHELLAEGLEVYVDDPLFRPEEIQAVGLSPMEDGQEYDVIIERGRFINPS